MQFDHDERAWSADKRDFVADRRDDVADDRDDVAGARDRAVDAREAELDGRERRLDAISPEPGASAAGADEPARRAAHCGRRVAARRTQDEARQERTVAAAGREESNKQREAEASPTRLAMIFADIAEQLYGAGSSDDVLVRIAEAAVDTVPGCAAASVTVADGSGFRTAAATDATATAVDQAQYQTGEGPCLDAVETPVVYAPSFPDERWPTLGARPTESGVQAALSHRLTTAGGPAGSAGEGSLNSYGLSPDAFDDRAQEIGLILAAHASVAARVVEERSTLQDLGRELEEAVLSRDVIGQAKGVLMERLKVSPEDAFDLLRRASQHLNVKLREVARGVAETGELSDRPRRPR